MSDKRNKPIEVADPLARQLVARYIGRRENDLALLDQALANSDFDTIRRSGHNLSGSGAAYGMHEVSRLGRCIEDAASSADVELTRRLLDELAVFVRTVKIP